MKFRKKTKIARSFRNSIKEEIKEIKSLEITDEDLSQAERITELVIQATGYYGIVLLPLKPIIKRVIAYGIRDIKDGVKTPDKLIIKRIIKEFKTK